MVNCENFASQSQVALRICMIPVCLILAMDCSGTLFFQGSLSLSLPLPPSLPLSLSLLCKHRNDKLFSWAQMPNESVCPFHLRPMKLQNLRWQLPVFWVLFMQSIDVVCVRVKIIGQMLLHSTWLLLWTYLTSGHGIDMHWFACLECCRFHNMSKSSGDSNFIQIQIPLDCYAGAVDNQKTDFFLLDLDVLGDGCHLSLDERVFPRCRRRVCRGSRRCGISNRSWLTHLIALE